MCITFLSEGRVDLTCTCEQMGQIYLRRLREPWHILDVVVVRWRRWWTVIGGRPVAADRYGTDYWWLNGGGRCRADRGVRDVLLLVVRLAVIGGRPLMRSIGENAVR